jgi:hypothetical protein
MKLQSLFGVIPRVYGKGKAAQHVADMMQRMLKERGALRAMPLCPALDTIRWGVAKRTSPHWIIVRSGGRRG